MSEKKIRVTWVKSAIHRQEKQKRIIEALGLKRLNHRVIHNDTPQIRGMINKVSHLVRAETVEA